MSFQGGEKFYQPVPFPEYKYETFKRKDCEERYEVIKENYGSFENKSLIDIACANGYFLFKFMLDKGNFSYGVENDENDIKFVQKLAKEKKLSVRCSRYLPDMPFDVGLYLDTHYHSGVDGDDYIKFLRRKCDVSFISASNRNGKYNQRLQDELEIIFPKVEAIYKGFADRIIFKCQRLK